MTTNPQASTKRPWDWLGLFFLSIALALGGYWWSDAGHPLRLVAQVRNESISGAPVDQREVAVRTNGFRLKSVTLRPSGSKIPVAIGNPGWSNLEIADINTGRVIYANDLSSSLKGMVWDNEQSKGHFNHHGQLVLKDNAGVTISDLNVTDVRISVSVSNNRNAIITGLATNGDRFEWQVRNLPDYDQRIQLKGVKGTLKEQASRGFVLDWKVSALVLIGRLSRFYLVGVGVMLASLVIALLTYLLGRFARMMRMWIWPKPIGPPRFAERLRTNWPLISAVLAMSMALGVGASLTMKLGTVADEYLERVPHVQDSVCYLFDAKRYASGHIFLAEPEESKAFEMQFMLFRKGKWYSIYPFGWPILLAIGVVAGKPWMVSPVISGINVVLTYLLGRVAFGSHLTGLVAAVLSAAAPFTVYMGASFMGHAASSMYEQILLLAFILALRKRSWNWGALTGLMVGLTFNTRPMNGLAGGLLCGTFLLWELIRCADTRKVLRVVFGFIGGSTVMAIIFFAFNWAMTGDAFTMPYEQYHAHFTQIRPKYGSIKWGPLIDQILQFTSMYNGVLCVAFFNWPIAYVWGSFSLLVLAFATLRFNRNDVMLLMLIFFTWLVYAPYPNKVLIFGPRYYFELIPAVMLLTARGMALTGNWARDMLAQWLGLETRRYPAAVVSVSIALAVGALAESNWDQFMNSKQFEGEQIYTFMPRRLKELKGFNYIKPHVQDKLKRAGIEGNALVFIDEERIVTWYRYGSVFHENDPLFREGSIIYARDLGESSRRKIMQMFPGRKYYITTYSAKDDIKELTPETGPVPLVTKRPTDAKDAQAGFRDLAWSRDGLAVADANFSKLTITDATGHPLSEITGITFPDGTLPLKSPRSVTFGSDGNVVVFDAASRSIARCNRSGRGLALIGPRAMDVNPVGSLASGPGGRLYWSDPDANKVFVLEKGVPRQFAPSVPLRGPYWLASDSNGRLAVANLSTRDVARLGANGELQGRFRPLHWPSQPRACDFLGMDSLSGETFLFLDERRELERYDTSGMFKEAVAVIPDLNASPATTFGIGTNAQKKQEIALVSRLTGTLYRMGVPEPGNLFKGGIGDGPGNFEFLRGVATDAQGNIFTIERDSERVQKFRPDGSFVREWGRSGPSGERLNTPSGIETDTLGRVFVTNLQDSYINFYDGNGTYLSSIRTNDQFRMYAPFDVDIDGEKRVIITNSGHRCLHVLKPETDFTYLFQFTMGREGKEDGEFSGDVMCTLVDSPNRRYLVTDRSTPRIQLFGFDGTFQGRWNLPGSDWYDMTWFTSSKGKRVVAVTRYGDTLLTLDENGTQLGTGFKPPTPDAIRGMLGPICTDKSNGDLIVLDRQLARAVRVRKKDLDQYLEALP